MAGKYATILNPGYSTLFTRDLPYLAGSGDVATTNPFAPSDARTLIEGEFLELVASGTSTRFTRGGNNVMAVSGTPDNEGTVPSFLYYQEEGRYDAQATKLAHCIMGPAFFEFRTKLCLSSGMTLGGKVSVWDYDPDGSIVRRALAGWSAGWVVGRVSRIYGTNDVSVIYGMQ